MSSLATAVNAVVHGADLVANLRWNPTIRGILFPAIQFLVLCGSCYVILATNLGNRLGFLVASAAFWGWMVLMTIVWMIYGIGLRGADPSWKFQEAIYDTSTAQFNKVSRIPSDGNTTGTPNGWKVVEEGAPMRGDAQAAIDAKLRPDGQTIDYVLIHAYRTGGDQILKVWPKIKKTPIKVKDPATGEMKNAIKKGKWYDPTQYVFRGLLHSPHYYVAQLQPMLMENVTKNGEIEFKDNGEPKTKQVLKDGKPVADTSKPVQTVVLLRDLGRRRQPAFMIFVASLVLLAVSLQSLHRRDKAVMAAMGKPRYKTA